MLCLETVIYWSWSRRKRALFASRALSLGGFAFSWTTSLITVVAPTVQECFTRARTLRLLFFTLMTDALRGRASASTFDFHRSAAWSADRRVALTIILMSTWQDFATCFLTMRNWIHTAFSRFICELGEYGLPTWTMGDQIRRAGAVSRFSRLFVAQLLATMLSTI